MSENEINNLIILAFITGFIGDAGLQLIVKNTKFDWGLREYFIQHNSFESLCIAGGMMALFYIIYFKILKLPVNFIYLIVYGIILDFLFRKAMLFPSLVGYYNHLNYFWSAFWGAIPIITPLIIYMYINKKN